MNKRLLTSFSLVGFLADFREKNAGKKAKVAKEKEVKKRKIEEKAPQKSGGGEGEEEEQGDQDVTGDN